MEANEASLGPGDATTRAHELRASLGVRKDAETMLAEASRVRQEAASAADAMVAEAQELSAQLVAESRRAAEQTDTDARERADSILARARGEAEEVADRARATADAIRTAAEAEIEEHRRRVRAEVTAQVTRELTEQHRIAEARAREQSEALVSDLEASVRILGVSLESARTHVSELLGSLEVFRSTADPAGPPPERDQRPARVEPPADDHVDDTPPPSNGTAQQLGGSGFGTGQTSAPASTVPVASSQFGTEPDEPEVDPGRPRSATEAFLSSSSLEIEQASRELRDLQNPEDARLRRGEENRRAAQRADGDQGAQADPEADSSEGTRPLGWLFRTAQ